MIGWPSLTSSIGIGPNSPPNALPPVDWDDLSTQLRERRDTKKPVLVQHPNDMVLTLGDRHAILTPVHNFVGFHLAIGPSKSPLATHPTGANGISMKKWQLRLPAYCGKVRSGDSESATDESDRKLSSVDHASPSVTPKAGDKRKSMVESAPMLSSVSDVTANIRCALEDYDNTALAQLSGTGRVIITCTAFDYYQAITVLSSTSTASSSAYGKRTRPSRLLLSKHRPPPSKSYLAASISGRDPTTPREPCVRKTVHYPDDKPSLERVNIIPARPDRNLKASFKKGQVAETKSFIMYTSNPSGSNSGFSPSSEQRTAKRELQNASLPDNDELHSGPSEVIRSDDLLPDEDINSSEDSTS
ncbi:hypothetical protein N7519_006663 [Penicillium mononematosum]|uniref:uncharacterized protein n=1 Tax=Penicillium mononematosum TaxID=268346 RepID=UPI0025476D5C|nr:uncharacterized protein N7519_006663 [Penicillium mononematosum]KAJ6185362.1 hypothetical protein N7519_006663 [Penicillium mononematosum]